MELKYWLFFVIGAVIFFLFKGKKPRPRSPSIPSARRPPTERIRSVANADDQLYFVTNSTFQKRTIMNKSEYALFCKLERMLSKHHRTYRVFPQVSLGEIIGSKDENAFRSINSKRVDFAIINAWGEPCAVVEYQGSGHYQGNAALRDAVKREACNKANVRFFEIPAQYSDVEIEQVERFLNSISS